MKKILQVDATITTRCRLQIVRDVYEKLDKNYKNKFSESCFGSLFRLKDIKLALQVIHQLLLRKIRTNKKEVWFKIGEKNAKFGLEEFILVTGLNAGDDNDVHKTFREECRIVKEYFKKIGGKITNGDAYNAFATEENTYIDLWWLDLVDDLDRFETYPWGNFSIEYTISIFKREMGDKLKSSDIGGESHCRYSLHSFPLAIMIWAFEAIPTLEMKFGDEAKHDAESQHAYHEESPRAAQPPQRGFEINIANLSRTEMEKLEERLQTVISTQLDRMEKKVDKLVELVVAVRFHPATSTFDGVTSITAYVSENEPKDRLEKEVGFDDVTYVHAAERKVDLPEEDSKLEEEEVRGKNIGRNELETEPGFDDVRDVPAVETNGA
ncbi:Hypothetical predicted protein [Olea europaea subsp. europaea]|uniref:DUF1985 domain-containing protein n=1 Tax=Olea europaea subsp. europaea TaxID=158383 RepID=A0A8S0PHI6_OLEEU|nr:Hypothetical predicted protein [Olea europaea subsp. europaea]